MHNGHIYAKTQILQWINGMAVELDVHARKHLDDISFDANIIQQQRGIIKLDEMVEQLRNLHATILEDLKTINEKRQKSEGQMIQAIYEETKRLVAARNDYEMNKQVIKSEMTKAVSELKESILGDLRDMSQSREDFEDFVLEKLERQSKNLFVTS
ncbi:double-strand break repair helicase AddA [Babesia caballi]|uniref:Double-strand break repair helicase AddA n=1 Tax=Babesia caballi TaxID=5871 RepID=A0AAV4M0L5_BABCB|nr:double-strand break repair helicase AddA [Babesia caballi]